MDGLILAQMDEEEARLVRRLEAVRAFRAAYADDVPKGSRATSPAQYVTAAAAHMSKAVAQRRRERVPLERFSAYGRSVVQAAIDEITTSPTLPVPTRELVGRIEQTGLTIRGDDKGNALSALLARSVDVQSNGRRGWTLASSHENEASEADAADASETALDAQEGGPQE